MEHTGHVMLVGEGAERFAVAMGFPRENLLTERSRKIWLLWKEYQFRPTTGGARALADPALEGRPTRARKPSRLWSDRIRQLNEAARRTSASNRNSASAAIRRVLVSAHRHDPLFGVERKRRNVGHHDHQRTCIQTARPLRRFSGHRRRLLHRSGRGLGRGDRQRGREHQGRRRAHHRREHAPWHVAARSRHGCAQAHRAQLQRRHDEAALHGHDVLHPAQGRRVCGRLSCGKDTAGHPHKIAVHDGTMRAEIAIRLLKGYSQECPPFPAEVQKIAETEYSK